MQHRANYKQLMLTKLAEKRKLYHGSPHKLDQLEPRQSRGTGADLAVFAAEDPDTAALYALTRPKSEKRTSWAVIDGKVHHVAGGPPLNKSGFVYELEADDALPPPKSDPDVGWKVKRAVKPGGRKRVYLRDHKGRFVEHPNKEAFKSAVSAALAARKGPEKPAVPYKLLMEANKDPFVRGYIRPRDKGKVRVPIVADGKVVGFHTPRKSRAGGTRVGPIYVRPEYRGRGLAAKAIAAHVEKHGGGRAFIASDNKASRKAFSAAGFKETDYEPRWGGGHWFRAGTEVSREKTAEKRPKSAVIIKGNPYYVGKDGTQREQSDKFYGQLKQLLEAKGYKVTFDAGEPRTSPPKADLWVGHSRGQDRLRFAPKGTKTIAVDGFQNDFLAPVKLKLKMWASGAKRVADIPVEQRPTPSKRHYEVSGRLRRHVEKTAEKKEEIPTPVVKVKEEEHKTGIPAMKPWFAPYPHQKAAIDKLYENHGKLILAHGTGTGKAQPLDAAVLTPQGWTTMGALEVGEELIDPDGGVCRVVAIHPQGVRPIFKVFFTDGSSTECCEEHLWHVRFKGANSPDKVRSLAELRDGYTHAREDTGQMYTTQGGFLNKQGYSRYYVPMVQPVEFSSGEVLPIDAYLFGALLGDGGLSGGTVRFTSADEEILGWVREALPSGVVLVHAEGYDWRLSSISSQKLGNPLIESLEKLGARGCRSWEKEIPDPYLLGSVSDRIALLQGLMDTDGTVSNGALSYTTVSAQLAFDVLHLVQSLGGRASIKERRTKYSHKGEQRTGRLSYRLHITLPAGVDPFRLQRKLSAYRDSNAGRRGPTRGILGIEYVGEKEAQCIEVDSRRNLYVTDDFIVTHNTASAIYGVEKMRHEGKAKHALVVVPSGLRMNFAENGIQKFTESSVQVVGPKNEASKNPMVVTVDQIDPSKDYTVISYSMFRRNPVLVMQKTGADTVVADEYHKVRNERTGTFKAFMAVRHMFHNFLGLTASLINNDPAEVATLLTISEGKRLVSPTEFKRRYIRTVGFQEGFQGGKKPVKDFVNVPHMLQTVYPRLDYVTSDDLKGKTMPKKDTKNVEVPMSAEQYRLYQLALDKLGPLKSYIMRRDENITLKEAEQLFAQLTQARQVANSVHMGRRDVSVKRSAEVTPKVRRMLDDTAEHLKSDPNHKVVLYSNLVRGGIDVLSAGLKSRGIDHALFVGKGTDIGGNKVTAEVRQQGVKDFQEGKKRVIVISGAGAEGLDLPNSTAFYALDGHFNPERILQAEARARRLGGQSFRPEEKRVVDVRRYQSVVPESEKPGFFGKLVGRKVPQTTDEWMYNVAGRKFQQKQKFEHVVRQPHKYIRKYRLPSGEWRYVYPKDAAGVPTAPEPDGFFDKLKFWDDK